jgi:hypothetical protein
MKLTTIGLAAALTLSGSLAFGQKSGVETTTGTIGPTSDTAPGSANSNSAGATGSASGNGPMNSSQADFNSSLKDGSAPRTSDPNSTTVGAGTGSTDPGANRSTGR